METESRKKIKIDLEENDVSDNEIVTLNHYCLVKVFSYLPLDDRIRLERVCKSWRNASKASWSNLKHWGIRYEKFIDRLFLREKKEKLSLEIKKIDKLNLKNILSRWRYIQSLILSKLSKEQVTKIVDICPDLETVHLAFMDNDVVNLVIKKCKKINALHLHNMNVWSDDKFLKNIFDNLHLRVFGIYNNTVMTGSCLESLSPEKIAEIYLYKCKMLNMEVTMKILQNFKNLRVLALSGSLSNKTEVFLNTLKKLNLDSLDISYNACLVDDKFIKKSLDLCKVSDSSQKFKLNIAGNNNVSRANPIFKREDLDIITDPDLFFKKKSNHPCDVYFRRIENPTENLQEPSDTSPTLQYIDDSDQSDDYRQDNNYADNEYDTDYANDYYHQVFGFFGYDVDEEDWE